MGEQGVGTAKESLEDDKATRMDKNPHQMNIDNTKEVMSANYISGEIRPNMRSNIRKESTSEKCRQSVAAISWSIRTCLCNNSTQKGRHLCRDTF